MSASTQPLDYLFGYRCELILADQNGDTFIVSGALRLPYGADAKPTIDDEVVARAIDQRNGARYRPAFREVKLVDA